jgi:glycosyltransferase involved in cell wall biosynthesis
MLAFLIPAHNEEQLLARTLEAIHRAGRASGHAYEIIVADDASTDRTAQIARSCGARVVPIQRRQIAAARNAAAREALRNPDTDVLIFVDADTIVPQQTVGAALAALAGGVVGGGAAVQFDGPVPHWAEVMLRIISLLFRLLRWSGGCFIFCTRQAYEATGGWNERLFASEEIHMAQALKRHGRFVLLNEPVITSGRKVREHSAREMLTTFLRLGMRGRRALSSRKDLAMWYGPRTGSSRPKQDGPATE